MEVTLAAAIERAAASIAGKAGICQTPDEYLPVAEVARVLDIGKNKAYEFVMGGAIPSVKLGGGRKVRRRALEEWMERMEGMDLTDPLHPVPIEGSNQ